MVTIVKPATIIKIDIDEFVLQSAIDANLSDYLKIITEDASGVVVYASKAGNHRFKDEDDSGDIFVSAPYQILGICRL